MRIIVLLLFVSFFSTLCIGAVDPCAITNPNAGTFTGKYAVTQGFNYTNTQLNNLWRISNSSDSVRIAGQLFTNLPYLKSFTLFMDIKYSTKDYVIVHFDEFDNTAGNIVSSSVSRRKNYTLLAADSRDYLNSGWRAQPIKFDLNLSLNPNKIYIIWVDCSITVAYIDIYNGPSSSASQIFSRVLSPGVSDWSTWNSVFVISLDVTPCSSGTSSSTTTSVSSTTSVSTSGSTSGSTSSCSISNPNAGTFTGKYAVTQGFNYTNIALNNLWRISNLTDSVKVAGQLFTNLPYLKSFTLFMDIKYSTKDYVIVHFDEFDNTAGNIVSSSVSRRKNYTLLAADSRDYLNSGWRAQPIKFELNLSLNPNKIYIIWVDSSITEAHIDIYNGPSSSASQIFSRVLSPGVSDWSTWNSVFVISLDVTPCSSGTSSSTTTSVSSTTSVSTSGSTSGSAPLCISNPSAGTFTGKYTVTQGFNYNNTGLYPSNYFRISNLHVLEPLRVTGQLFTNLPYLKSFTLLMDLYTTQDSIIVHFDEFDNTAGTIVSSSISRSKAYTLLAADSRDYMNTDLRAQPVKFDLNLSLNPNKIYIIWVDSSITVDYVDVYGGSSSSSSQLLSSVLSPSASNWTIWPDSTFLISMDVTPCSSGTSSSTTSVLSTTSLSTSGSTSSCSISNPNAGTFTGKYAVTQGFNYTNTALDNLWRISNLTDSVRVAGQLFTNLPYLKSFTLFMDVMYSDQDFIKVHFDEFDNTAGTIVPSSVSRSKEYTLLAADSRDYFNTGFRAQPVKFDLNLSLNPNKIYIIWVDCSITETYIDVYCGPSLYDSQIYSIFLSPGVSDWSSWSYSTFVISLDVTPCSSGSSSTTSVSSTTSLSTTGASTSPSCSIANPNAGNFTGKYIVSSGFNYTINEISNWWRLSSNSTRNVQAVGQLFTNLPYIKSFTIQMGIHYSSTDYVTVHFDEFDNVAGRILPSSVSINKTFTLLASNSRPYGPTAANWQSQPITLDVNQYLNPNKVYIVWVDSLKVFAYTDVYYAESNYTTQLYSYSFPPTSWNTYPSVFVISIDNSPCSSGGITSGITSITSSFSTSTTSASVSTTSGSTSPSCTSINPNAGSFTGKYAVTSGFNYTNNQISNLWRLSNQTNSVKLVGQLFTNLPYIKSFTIQMDIKYSSTDYVTVHFDEFDNVAGQILPSSVSINKTYTLLNTNSHQFVPTNWWSQPVTLNIDQNLNPNKVYIIWVDSLKTLAYMDIYNGLSSDSTMLYSYSFPPSWNTHPSIFVISIDNSPCSSGGTTSGITSTTSSSVISTSTTTASVSTTSGSTSPSCTAVNPNAGSFTGKYAVTSGFNYTNNQISNLWRLSNQTNSVKAVGQLFTNLPYIKSFTIQMDIKYSSTDYVTVHFDEFDNVVGQILPSSISINKSYTLLNTNSRQFVPTNWWSQPITLDINQYLNPNKVYIIWVDSLKTLAHMDVYNGPSNYSTQLYSYSFPPTWIAYPSVFVISIDNSPCSSGTTSGSVSTSTTGSTTGASCFYNSNSGNYIGLFSVTQGFGYSNTQVDYRWRMKNVENDIRAVGQLFTNLQYIKSFSLSVNVAAQDIIVVSLGEFDNNAGTIVGDNIVTKIITLFPSNSTLSLDGYPAQAVNIDVNQYLDPSKVYNIWIEGTRINNYVDIYAKKESYSNNQIYSNDLPNIKWKSWGTSLAISIDSSAC